jgi:hypothetical protein
MASSVAFRRTKYVRLMVAVVSLPIINAKLNTIVVGKMVCVHLATFTPIEISAF